MNQISSANEVELGKPEKKSERARDRGGPGSGHGCSFDGSGSWGTGSIGRNRPLLNDRLSDLQRCEGVEEAVDPAGGGGVDAVPGGGPQHRPGLHQMHPQCRR